MDDQDLSEYAQRQLTRLEADGNRIPNHVKITLFTITELIDQTLDAQGYTYPERNQLYLIYSLLTYLTHLPLAETL